MTDHYQTLGISETASQDEIKMAFKKLAVKYHPDKHGGHPEMEERFKAINEAYQILSNPYERARYDLRKQFNAASSYQEPTNSPNPYAYHRPRRPFVDPRINWRENWIATAYAFGFTLIMAIIVMSVIGIKEYYDQKNIENRLAERRIIFQEVQLDYEKGKVEAALVSLNDLGVFGDGEQDMRSFKELLYIEFLDKAEKHYKSGKYEDAIYYFELIHNYGPRTTSVLEEHLANAYRASGQLEKAITKYHSLILADYHLLHNYLSLAQIYQVQLNQPGDALLYYELASEEAIKQYKSIYGEAYPLVLSGRILPLEHYYLYSGLARAYLETGNPERALKAINWNINMWPDGQENYVTAARSHFQLGHFQRACNALAKAQSLGYFGEIGIDCP